MRGIQRQWSVNVQGSVWLQPATQAQHRFITPAQRYLYATISDGSKDLLPESRFKSLIYIKFTSTSNKPFHLPNIVCRAAGQTQDDDQWKNFCIIFS